MTVRNEPRRHRSPDRRRREGSLAGQGLISPLVHPEHHGRGAGSALLAAGEAHLNAVGVRRGHAWTVDEPRSLAFAARHGYRPTRRADFLRLALARAVLPPLPAALPPGVRLCTGADFGADPRPLYAADAEAAADEPADVAADAAILAINRAFGYRRCGGEVRHVREWRRG
ncbi:GNAT family N-acetyltransferase [Streptomyces noursei]|uniref:GNAT family N-acetyltransferase n=1 Tax=Streptomyces noursei TaxID=1971 RepID=UPI0033275F70